jgi:hypothetical protein
MKFKLKLNNGLCHTIKGNKIEYKLNLVLQIIPHTQTGFCKTRQYKLKIFR